MRKLENIIFRGKLQNGFDDRWIYGNLVYLGDHPRICDDVGMFNVVDESIGEYVGLSDMYDHRIFEGDILRYDGSLGKGTGRAEIDRIVWISGPLSKTGKDTPLFQVKDAGNLEIIGNAFDQMEEEQYCIFNEAPKDKEIKDATFGKYSENFKDRTHRRGR